MLMDTSPPPPPTPYGEGEGQEGPPGTAFRLVDEHLVTWAFRGTSKKKSLGPDGIGPLAISCVYDWEPDRVVALISGPGTHPDRWKMVRGVTITKPDKDDYSLAKSYRCISLLNCL